jgi:DNA-binding phage protein
MRLLHAGVDTTAIALWLGHEQVETTQIYLHATSRSKNKLSRGPSHSVARQAAIARQTVCSHFSKRSEPQLRRITLVDRVLVSASCRDQSPGSRANPDLCSAGSSGGSAASANHLEVTIDPHAMAGGVSHPGRNFYL